MLNLAAFRLLVFDIQARRKSYKWQNMGIDVHFLAM